MEQARKLILYIAMSLDGYIAEPNDDLSFLSLVEQEGEDYGYANFVDSVGVVLMGRKTYDKVLSMEVEQPHGDVPTYIITRTYKDSTVKNVHYHTGDVYELVSKLKAERGKYIYCDGGSELVNSLLQRRCFDELIISIIPILLGDGIALFKNQHPQQKLELLGSKSFEKGLVQLHYRCL